MNRLSLEEIGRAILYEGYVLYPYRASSPKNQRERFTFGRVYPQVWSDAQQGAEDCFMQTECLVQGQGDRGLVGISVRFLQPLARLVGRLPAPLQEWPAERDLQLTSQLQVGDIVYTSWHEATERVVAAPALPLGSSRSLERVFAFEAFRTLEPLQDRTGQFVGALVRHSESISGTIRVQAHVLTTELSKITATVSNTSAVPPPELNPDGVLTRTFASTHTLLEAQEAQFVSLLEPPPGLETAAKECQNIGTWPVLVGEPGKSASECMLSSPILLYDYPRIAPESRGDFFDATEIDELLTLRIQTLTDSEKQQMRSLEAETRRLLARVEGLAGEELLRMHGAMRQPVLQQTRSIP
jgi:hydrogenase maturation protease